MGAIDGRQTRRHDAARAYDKAALEPFGKFARLNLPDPVKRIGEEIGI